MDSEKYSQIANRIRHNILNMTHPVGSGHPTSSFSAVELLTMLFFKYLRYDIANPDRLDNDRVIFSKGHASALYYSLYEAAGAITSEELLTYRKTGSSLEGHPTHRFKFAEAATGSLGQGLSIAAGQAWALRKLFKEDFVERYESRTETITDVSDIQSSQYDSTIRIPFSIPRIFCLLGDGEMAEGSIWEAIGWSSFKHLNNLIAIVDVNRLGQYAQTMIGEDLEAYRARFEAFGWGAIVIDGHDWSQIDAAYEKAIVYKNGPVAIIARTKKGYDLPYWMDKPGFHNQMLPEGELRLALETYKKNMIQTPTAINLPEPDLPGSKSGRKKFFRDMPAEMKPDTYEPGQLIATKKAFAQAILKIAQQLPQLIVLDGDVANSLHTDTVEKKLPFQFLQMFISEQNMAGVSIGLSKRGFLPVINTFAAFLTRAHDQLRMMPLSASRVMVNMSYAGVSVGRDGPSQEGLEDIALGRSIFGSVVLYPCDARQTEILTHLALSHPGVSFIRTTRQETPVVYGKETQFELGGCHTFESGLKGNKESAVVVIAAGITVIEALKAQKILAEEGIGIDVIDCYSIKPIAQSVLQEAAGKYDAFIVAEDHFPEGGLGEAVLSAMGSHKPKKFIHLAVNKLPASASPQECLSLAQIDSQAICDRIRHLSG